MKRLLFILIFALLSLTTAFAGIYTPKTVPNPKQWGQDYYVSNPDGILSQAAVDSLNRLAWSLEQATGDVELAIVVLGSYRLNEEEEPNTSDLFQFNLELFELWGIGKAGSDRGLLITVSYDSHQMFISTGSSLDSDLPDAACLYIQTHYMLPHFKEDDYDKGLIDGVIAIYGYLVDEGVKAKIDKEVESGGDGDGWTLFILIAAVVGVVFIKKKLGGGTGSGGSGYSSGGFRSSGGSSSSRGSWGGGHTSGGGAGSRW